MSAGQTGAPAQRGAGGAGGAVAAATLRFPSADALRLARHCTSALGDDGALPVTGDGVILVEALSRESEWLTYVLLFDRQEPGCWTLYQVGHPGNDDDYLLVADLNEGLRDPAAVAGAQQWAARVVAVPRSLEHSAVDLAVGLAEPVPPRRVTEWRTVRHDGWLGYVPLFNVTQRCEVPVSLMNPETGADCICRYLPQGASLGSGRRG
ncbi:hypothetical protein ACTOB_003759 [Actinoplanes oblitus]|uniref:Uncharacterized protein n=1 Tax=Actinoplanes oblitus TaxID=3040509 RepID=A0ABY8WTE3_9ACTN|nr:hypothetical protein [Actinoplanes oblitus]WIN00078.1 hypothetical protein ACTOB_003759 [Actinoplanes oblitus]